MAPRLHFCGPLTVETMPGINLEEPSRTYLACIWPAAHGRYGSPRGVAHVPRSRRWLKSFTNGVASLVTCTMPEIAFSDDKASVVDFDWARRHGDIFILRWGIRRQVLRGKDLKIAE